MFRTRKAFMGAKNTTNQSVVNVTVASGSAMKAQFNFTCTLELTLVSVPGAVFLETGGWTCPHRIKICFTFSETRNHVPAKDFLSFSTWSCVG